MTRAWIFALGEAAQGAPEVRWIDPEVADFAPAPTSRHSSLVPVLVTPDAEAAKRQRCPSCGQDDGIRFLGGNRPRSPSPPGGRSGGGQVRCRPMAVGRGGGPDGVQITELACLWYGSFRSRTVRVILVRDDKPRTHDRDDGGYGLPLVTTNLESQAEDLGPYSQGSANLSTWIDSKEYLGEARRGIDLRASACHA